MNSATSQNFFCPNLGHLCQEVQSFQQDDQPNLLSKLIVKEAQDQCLAMAVYGFEIYFATKSRCHRILILRVQIKGTTKGANNIGILIFQCFVVFFPTMFYRYIFKILITKAWTEDLVVLLKKMFHKIHSQIKVLEERPEK